MGKFTFNFRGTPVGFAAVGLALLASMGGFIFGYDTGQISGILLMNDFKYRFAEHGNHEFSIGREGLIVSLLSIGTFFGALFGANLADWLGRRKAMSLECAVFIIGVLIQVTAFKAWYQLMIGRFISGLGVGALSAAVPLYQSETAPKQLRGSLVGTYQLFITFGILIAYCINIGTRGYVTNGVPSSASWRVPVAIGIVWGLILGIGILFMPESPRWLLERDLDEQAERSIARIRGVDFNEHNEFVERDFREMKNKIEAEKAIEEASWIECFHVKQKLLYRTILGMVLQSLQQLTGANYFFYYGATIFQSVGIQDSFVTQIILGAVNFGCTFLGLYVLERFGRRIPLMVGGVWQSIWLFVFAAAGTARDPTGDEHIGKLMIVSACLFILGYASTWAPGIWVFVGESFPTRTRAKQAALATSANWIWNFLLAFFTPFISKAIHYRYGFVFAACNLAGAVITFLFVYETKDLSLEAVDAMYNDSNCKPWTSRQWVPEGYASRAHLVQQTKASDIGKPLEAKEVQHRENGGVEGKGEHVV